MLINYFSKILTGGDWVVFFKETIRELSFFPYIWSPTNGNGLGQNISFVLGYKYFFAVITKFLLIELNLPWSVTEKFIFFIPFWLISILSSYYLASYLFKSRVMRSLSSIIFSFNTYSLMLVGGGQMGVALGYSISPLVLTLFLKSLSKSKMSNFLLLGVISGLQMMFDPRLFLITIVLCFLHLVYCYFFERKISFISGIKLFFSLTISVALNLFWILPILISKQISVGEAYTSADMVKFLSFATLENSFSLLHPNWPENIFGKVYFMKPEFLILPVLAFTSILFLNYLDKKDRKYVILFSIIYLISAFFAKGTNEPFGYFYLWLSNNIPGFTMFRDPTKFYTLIAISMSVLIPFTLYGFEKKFKKNEKIITVIFLLIWIILIRQFFLGQLTGTFKEKTIPTEYLKLEKFISRDSNFYRTFWFPVTDRYGLFSNSHPSISSYDFYNLSNSLKILTVLSNPKTESTFKDSSIRYLIVPYDSEKEIFLKDRKYNEAQYTFLVNSVRKIRWLKEISGFGKIKVFEIAGAKDHFWLSGFGQVRYKYISSVDYQINLKNVKKGDLLIFSESFDNNWIAMDLGYKNQDSTIESKRYQIFNSFKFQRDGSYDFIIYYQPQKWVNIGIIISALSLASVLGFLIFGWVTKKW